jgi:hypothetical protein
MQRLRALPEPQRAALVMRELEGLSHEEIAAALGVSGGAARQAIHRARTALREGLGFLVPLPALRMLTEHGAEMVKAGAATVLVAGAVGTGVAVEERQSGRSPEAAVAAPLSRQGEEERGRFRADRGAAFAELPAEGDRSGSHGEEGGGGPGPSERSGPSDDSGRIDDSGSRGRGSGDDLGPEKEMETEAAVERTSGHSGSGSRSGSGSGSGPSSGEVELEEDSSGSGSGELDGA